MIKLGFGAFFPDGTDRPEAFRYWRDVHGPIVTRIPGLRRYVQHHAVEGYREQPAFAGWVEFWFDSREDLERAADSPEWKAATADSETFLDMSRTMTSLIEEHPVL